MSSEQQTNRKLYCFRCFMWALPVTAFIVGSVGVVISIRSAWHSNTAPERNNDLTSANSGLFSLSTSSRYLAKLNVNPELPSHIHLNGLYRHGVRLGGSIHFCPEKGWEVDALPDGIFETRKEDGCLVVEDPGSPYVAAWTESGIRFTLMDDDCPSDSAYALADVESEGLFEVESGNLFEDSLSSICATEPAEDRTMEKPPKLIAEK